MSNDYMQECALEFDSIITADASGGEFSVLPAGTYPFMIEKIERDHVSSEKSKYNGCPMAKVTFILKGTDENGEEVEVHRTENFILHTKFIWKISQLFISVGLVKSGEQFRPNWQALPTRTGMCDVSINEYEKRGGGKGRSNQIDKYLEPAPAQAAQAAAPAQPSWKSGF